ncbi:hypothetical protein CFC21_056538 [Triticum aestivum]|uniref:F-box domain-containing protein n=3 Tax=Triticum TaxID=4564 RepID=A0A9R0SV08_TRITD|nr:uncharacterized protein LOC123090946 [Triticum aestivum]KAF7047641.1 hypothetical protein CFC21_056538 [Triticum aestivum]VAI01979.1 unnamed protein product [Triticum turgidum subsp. durum]
MSSAVVFRRVRSRSSPGRFDSTRRTRPRVEEAERPAGRGEEKADVVSALPDDMLLEVFRRLPPPTGAVRCGAVCRRWRRVVSRAPGLPAPPRHFGFFRNHGPSALPPFVPTAGVALGLGFLPVSPACGVILVDCRGHRLLLHELGRHLATELNLLVCNPLEKTFVRLPPLPTAGHTVFCHTIVPGEGAEFRVLVVLFGATSPNFYILIYSSASSAWEVATGALKRPLMPDRGPTAVVGDVVYMLPSDANPKYILSVNTAKMTMSGVPLPNAEMPLYTGNNWIGKTEDGRLCFFAIREPLLLVKWVLDAPRTWTPQEPVSLRQLMTPATVGDLHGMKLSARIGEQISNGCKLVSFGGFCEGTGTLFFVMADRVVSLDIKTFKMERLWRNDDEWRPLGDVFPYEMVAWPPALKDLVKPPVNA